jgi:uncharacterized protein (DUF4415 family)
MFAWDEAKLRANLKKHGIDLAEHSHRRVTTFASFQFGRPRNMKRATTSRKSSTKLSTVRKMIDADIVRDGDAPEWTPEMFARAVARKGLRPVPKKALLSLRIDSDVIEWFKRQGAGYQSRMNALLRAYMEAHK